MKREMNWDGEKIKEVVKETSKKHTPKDILNGLDHVRGQIHQLKDAATQLEQQTKTNETNLRSAERFKKELKRFEDKCIELQTEKVKEIILQIHEDSVKSAKKSSELAISRTPEAYNEEQKKQLPFLDYQKLLATNDKMAKKISGRIIRKCLYDEPVFDNPFKD